MTGPVYPQDIEALNPSALPEIGQFNSNVRSVTIPLDNALNDYELEITGTVLWAEDATDTDANLTVKFNERAGEGLTFKNGKFFGGWPFSRLFVSCAAQAGKSITLVYARETANIRIENPSASFQDVSIAKSDTFDGVADVVLNAVGTTQLLAADSTRVIAHITNISGNASTIRIGGNGSVGAAQGTPVAPGETLTLETTDEIHAYNPGAAQNVAISITQD